MKSILFLLIVVQRGGAAACRVVVVYSDCSGNKKTQFSTPNAHVMLVRTHAHVHTRMHVHIFPKLNGNLTPRISVLPPQQISTPLVVSKHVTHRQESRLVINNDGAHMTVAGVQSHHLKRLTGIVAMSWVDDAKDVISSHLVFLPCATQLQQPCSAAPLPQPWENLALPVTRTRTDTQRACEKSGRNASFLQVLMGLSYWSRKKNISRRCQGNDTRS